MRDLCLALNSDGTYFSIIPEQDNTMPDILRTAIVLLFFSKTESMRFFQGEGLYGILAQITSNSQEFLQSHLSVISSDLRQILTKIYPDISGVYLDYEIIGSTLNINININKDDETITEPIYSKQL